MVVVQAVLKVPEPSHDSWQQGHLWMAWVGVEVLLLAVQQSVCWPSLRQVLLEMAVVEVVAEALPRPACTQLFYLLHGHLVIRSRKCKP